MDSRSLSVALIASSGNAKEPLLKTHLAPAATSRTGLRYRPWLCSTAVTRLARAMSWYFDFLFGSGNCFLKTEGEIIAKIFTPSAAAAPAGAAAEKLAENVAKNIFETCAKIESAGKRSAITESRVSKLVILRASLRVGKDLIGLGDFFELFLRLFVSGITIGVVLERQFTVRLFQVILAGGSIDTEQIVVIFFVAQATTSC